MAEAIEKKEKKTSPHLLTLKNIIIGVTTTVLGALAIYFLGIQKGPSEAEKRKKATVKVWNDYLVIRKTTHEVMESMNKQKSGDMNTVRANTNHEIQMINEDMEKLTKIPDVDINMVRIMNLDIAAMNDYLKVYNAYVDDMVNFDNQHPTDQEGMAFLQQRAPVFYKDAMNIFRRDSIHFDTYYKTLKKEYKVEFPEKSDQ